ncbi:MAG: C4-type zinc ribbon domain-containing protein [Acidobacteriota bacterium]|nr:C4-type zinc ribbon domain-containing protein [Acidobacteriota bacterium]MDH3522764.1 C4-type zinc ribbon domain-containing protein [Acidobacteriota bacterium]
MTTIETIVDLQHAYTELGAAEELLQGIPDWMQELHEEYGARRTEIEAIAAAIELAAAERRGAEAGVADTQERLKHYQEQIGQVRNQREYSALLQEIDLVKQQILGFEEQALQALEQQETEQARLDEERQAFAELESRYQQELEKWEAQKPEVAAGAEKLRGRIEVLEGRLPPPILHQFRLIRERFDGVALAEVRELQRVGKGRQMWHCSGCNYRVLPQSLVEIRNNGSVVLCDSCKRILYYVEDAG